MSCSLPLSIWDPFAAFILIFLYWIIMFWIFQVFPCSSPKTKCNDLPLNPTMLFALYHLFEWIDYNLNIYNFNICGVLLKRLCIYNRIKFFTVSDFLFSCPLKFPWKSCWEGFTHIWILMSRDGFTSVTLLFLEESEQLEQENSLSTNIDISTMIRFVLWLWFAMLVVMFRVNMSWRVFAMVMLV